MTARYTNRNNTITDADLMAFADGQLPPERRAEVDAWLSTNPERAAEGRWGAGDDVVFIHTGGLPALFTPDGTPATTS